MPPRSSAAASSASSWRSTASPRAWTSHATVPPPTTAIASTHAAPRIHTCVSANRRSVQNRTAKLAFHPGNTQDVTHGSDVELEVDDVAVFDDVLLAFELQLGVGAAGALGAVLDEVFPPDYLGLDEAAFEVGVDEACRLGGLGAALDGPGAALVGAGGEEGDEVENLVRGVGHGVQAGLLQAEALQKGRTIGGVEAGDLRLGGGADDDHRRSFGLGVGAQRADELVGGGAGELLLGDVGDVEDLLQGQQAHVAEQRLRFGVQSLRARRLAFVEARFQLFAQVEDELLLFDGLPLERLLGPLDPLVDGLQVFETELGVDGGDVGHRINAPLDVDDVVVLEAADDVGDGVGLADVGQKLIAEAFTLGGPAHQAGDVDEVHRRGHHRLRVVELDQRVEPRVGDRHHADVRLDGAERVVRHGGARRRQRVEERRLAHVGQPDDATRDSHQPFSLAQSSGHV